ncbi:MAG: TerB family tellurite resistance protein [Mariprofundales bacterium]|nr:TerB family tellurite resistance protein [Mariprofundales bacterium]
MSLLGAGIGAGIGALIGGPIGAGIGGWLGHSIGSAYQQAQQQQGVSNGGGGSPLHLNQDEAQSIFFVALFSMLAKMANADGRVDSSEADLINELARTQFKMDTEDRRAAGTIFTNALKDSYSIYDYAKQYRQIAGSREMCEMVYRLLFAVAYADNSLHGDEDAILQQIPDHLGLDQSYYHMLLEEFRGNRPDIDEAYKVLGCDANSSDSEIKSAYRKLCKEYHPDTIAAKGLPEGFIQYAEQQMHLINEAYQTIKDHRR